MKRALFCLSLFALGCGDNAQSCPPDSPLPDEVNATPLPAAVDADSWQSKNASFSDCQPQRMFTFHGSDESLTKLNDPTVELLTDKLHVCIFVACDVGATHIKSCHGNATEPVYSESALGTRGCCTENRDTLSVRYSCEDSVTSLVSDDSANLFVQLCPAQTITENDFSFRYHF
ncbi:MAG: hypothetical protein KC776_21160 [Myxococcales bacterium]|nr:hypothetical protein [Myxococcales bacterium]MCB9581533.1 hypothetical protein [Polyangiaceae bacterium]